MSSSQPPPKLSTGTNVSTPQKAPKAPTSVLFVCLGNICRSTMAEAVFKSVTKPHHQFSRIDSCGTGAYHIGSSPDPRTMNVLRDNGVEGYTHAARIVRAGDFREFDYVLAMDRDNLVDLQAFRDRAARGGGEKTGVEKGMGRGKGKIMLFGDFGGRKGEEVEDPYYGGKDGFKVAFEQMERFSRGFLRELVGRKDESDET